MYKIIIRDYIANLKWSLIKKIIFYMFITIITIFVLIILLDPFFSSIIINMFSYVYIFNITALAYILLKNLSMKTIPKTLYLCPIDLDGKKKYLKRHFILKIIILMVVFLLSGLPFLIEGIIRFKLYVLAFINILLILCIANTNIINLYKYFNKKSKIHMNEFKDYELELLLKIINLACIISFLAFIFNGIRFYMDLTILAETMFEQRLLDLSFIINIILIVIQIFTTIRIFKYWDIIVYINTDYEETYLK